MYYSMLDFNSEQFEMAWREIKESEEKEHEASVHAIEECEAKGVSEESLLIIKRALGV